MKVHDELKSGTFIEQYFYGSVTVGERGQVVIPAKARRDYNIECGDQLLIMGHPTKNGLMIAKVDAIRTFLSQMIDDLKFIESQHADAPAIDDGLTYGVEQAAQPAAQEGK